MHTEEWLDEVGADGFTFRGRIKTLFPIKSEANSEKKLSDNVFLLIGQCNKIHVFLKDNNCIFELYMINSCCSC